MLFRLPRKNRFLTLTGDTRTSVISEVTTKQGGQRSLRVIAMTEGAITDDVTLPRLLSSTTESLSGDVSAVLPLHYFEIITVQLAQMPDEAIERSLPYQLAKAVATPLSEYVYDWQITQRLKDKLLVTVYLLRKKTFEHLRNELNRRQATIKYLEADIFATFALLAGNNKLATDGANLCVIIWPAHISFAVYENRTMVMARTVYAKQPDSVYSGFQELSPVPKQEGIARIDLEPDLLLELENPDRQPEAESTSFADAVDDDDFCILEDFSLLCKDKPEQKTEAGAETEPSPITDSDATPPSFPEDGGWGDYLQHINLEIMRTRDYHSSVLKGGAIKKFFITGADKFWDDLRSLSRGALGIEMENIADPAMNKNLSSTFSALCLGTAIR